MRQLAKVTGKYQTTIPVAVRRALGINARDRLSFEIGENQTDVVTIRRYPTLDEVAGSVPVPADLRGLEWSEVRMRAWAPATARGTRPSKRR